MTIASSIAMVVQFCVRSSADKRRRIMARGSSRARCWAETIAEVAKGNRQAYSVSMATATHQLTDSEARAHPPGEAVVVRFAGDSGDGMQLTGGQFTLSTALAGNDLATFPDFPAEIRAPQGTTFGVS